MTRTAVTPTKLTGDGVSVATAVNIDVTNGMTLAAAQPEMTTLLITNTDTNAHEVTLRSGDPVTGVGMEVDQAFVIPASSSRYLGPFTSARCQQRDGSMSLDFTAGHTGTVVALVAPRGI
jgi:hypothetical protein